MYEQVLLKPKAADADKSPEIEVISLIYDGGGDG